MSSISRADLRLIDELVEFIRGRGYVLGFSDITFSEFFADELNVDIDDPVYAANGGSKGKRLRTFLAMVDDETATRTLNALWAHRAEFLASTGNADPVHNAEGRYLTLLRKLSGGPNAGTGEPGRPVHDRQKIEAFRNELYQLRDFEPQRRGYAFESFLQRLFDDAGLAPRQPFRNVGEQIDGSFVLDSEVYLLEAKWTRSEIGAADLHAFHGKLDKAAWTRGVFISYGGFTADGLKAFGTARRMFCVEGRDIYEGLERQIPLIDILRAKIRQAAETGDPFVPLERLFPLAA
ncbi:restriction endonuclease [Sphingomonas sp. GCM10030256]|uniref:restriction endonuclease n=1 Tax=Sphingomonas sp. GCM10030256 TaxID=3273427 RepID=UPI00361F2D1B